jgi:Ankyrin repeats (3 copies)
VFCQLELLCQAFPSSVRRILEELPEGLDETYERILREIGKPNQKHAYRLLQCLVAADRPLRVEELAEVVAVDFDSGGTPMLNPGWRWSDQQEAVLSACSSLVMIVKESDSWIVQFSHFSVKEFLLSSRLAESSKDVSRYHIQLEPAHTILVQACLGVLLGLDDSVDRDSIESFPLARYAAQYWVKHARFGNVSSRIADGMDCLFDEDRRHFATWLWIYNEDRYGDGSLSTMRPSKPEAVPLYYAAHHGFRDLAERLLARHPGDLNAEGGNCMTPSYASFDGRHHDVFTLFVDHFPAVDIRIGWGYTPLHLAAGFGQLEVGQWLLGHGADVNARNDYGLTPLHMAAVSGQLESARMLLEHEAPVDVPAHDGETPLHRASRNGHIEITQLLLENGADRSARNKEGVAPFELASSIGQQEIMRVC